MVGKLEGWKVGRWERLELAEDVTIYLGDCREIIPKLKGVDAVVSDPPYGINYQRGTGGRSGQLANDVPVFGDDEPFDPTHLMPLAEIKGGGVAGCGCPVVLWGANYYADKLPPGMWLCWDKACGVGPHSSFSDAEFAWTNRKTPRSIFHHLWLGLIRAGTGNPSKMKRTHPSQKPVELMAWCMQTCRVGLGKTVLDPYMGTGTTGVACIQTGRKFIGIEIVPKYFEIAKKRLLEALESRKCLVNP